MGNKKSTGIVKSYPDVYSRHPYSLASERRSVLPPKYLVLIFIFDMGRLAIPKDLKFRDGIHYHQEIWQLIFVLESLFSCTQDTWGTAVAQWLRCCATIRKVAGAIPAGVSGIFD